MELNKRLGLKEPLKKNFCEVGLKSVSLDFLNIVYLSHFIANFNFLQAGIAATL
jgi:hypothetical protein